MTKLCVSEVPHTQDGPWSWLVCFSALMSWMAAMGFVFSFGIFFPVFREFFKEDRERIAWVGSLSIALVFFTGPVSGIMVKKLGCRFTNILGGIICAASLGIASLSRSLVALYFSYSIPFGIGTSFIFSASLVIVSSYFNKRRSLALGCTTAGLGLGVLVQGPLLQELIDSYGWKTTYRIMAGVVFGSCLFGLTYDSNVKPEAGERDNQENFEQSSSGNDNQSNPRRLRIGLEILPDMSVWKVPAFSAIALSSAVVQFGHYVPQIHLVQFCEELGITAKKASKLYVYYGLASAIVRIPVGRLIDVTGINPFYLYQSVEFVVGLSAVLVTLASDYTVLVAFAVIYGLCDGVFVTTINILVMSSVEATKRPAALGWQMQSVSIFLASGPPMAGLMADKLGSYDGAFYMAGGAIILGAAIPFCLLCTKRREADQRQEMTTDNETGIDVFANENVTVNLDADEGISEAPSDTKMPCTKRNGSSLKKSCKDENTGSGLSDPQSRSSQLPFYVFVNKSFTWSDEAISNDTEMAQTGPQTDVNASRVPSIVREDDQETMEQLQYNTRL